MLGDLWRAGNMLLGAAHGGSALIGGLAGYALLAPKDAIECRLAVSGGGFWRTASMEACRNEIGFISSGVLLNPEARAFIGGAIVLAISLFVTFLSKPKPQ